MKTQTSHIVPLTDLQRAASRLVKTARTTKEPIIVTQHGRPAVVLVDCEVYEELERTAQNVAEGPSPTTRETALHEELARIVTALTTSYAPEKIILFGSLASGAVHDASDIDLVVIKNTTKRFWDRQKEVACLVKPRLACDIIVYTPKEWAQALREGRTMVHDEIAGKGKVIYERAA